MENLGIYATISNFEELRYRQINLQSDPSYQDFLQEESALELPRLCLDWTWHCPFWDLN